MILGDQISGHISVDCAFLILKVVLVYLKYLELFSVEFLSPGVRDPM